jgi:predicted dehydrogenase
VRPWRLALVGFGAQAEKAHLPAILGHRGLSLVGVVDPMAGRRRRAVQLCPGLPVARSLADLAPKVGALHAVVLAGPPSSREPTARAVRDLGVPAVLLEKPLAHTRHSLGQVARLCQDLSVMPCHTWRYSSLYRAAARCVRDGQLGKIRRVVLRTERMEPARGCQEWRSNWRIDGSRSGGGILVDHGYHYLYLLHELLGEVPSRVLRARCLHRRGLSVEDECTLKVGFDSETTADVFLTWNAQRRRVSGRVVGEKGELSIDDQRVVLQLHRGRERVIAEEGSISRDGVHQSWYRSLYRDFARLLERRPARQKDAGIALAINDLIFRAYEAAGGSTCPA